MFLRLARLTSISDLFWYLFADFRAFMANLCLYLLSAIRSIQKVQKITKELVSRELSLIEIVVVFPAKKLFANFFFAIGEIID